MDILGTSVQDIGRVLIAAVPAAGTALGLLRGPGAVRSRLKSDLELLEKMPEGTVARTRFEEYLATQVEHFAKYETEATRDIKGLLFGGIWAILFAAAALVLFSFADWWWWIGGGVFAFLTLLATTVMFDDAQKVPRDDKGDRL